MILGAGRETKEDTIDMAAGLLIHKKVGDEVEKGEVLVTLYSNKKDMDEAVKKTEHSFQIAAEAKPLSLIHTIIEDA